MTNGKPGTGGFQKIGSVPVPEAVSWRDAQAKAALDQIARDLDAGKIMRGSALAELRPVQFRDWQTSLDEWLERQLEAGRGFARWTTYAVLQHVIRRVNDDGEAWPGRERLCAAAGCVANSARRALRELETCGVLEPNAGKKGSHGPRVLRFSWPLPDLPPKQPDGSLGSAPAGQPAPRQPSGSLGTKTQGNRTVRPKEPDGSAKGTGRSP
ncbi:helix-turn-helix domain-containing protein [Aliiruegeria haliotis]|uniref:helix-turn-helix domain-containing protein n=1 Tax=Aliiruegeria haliotis TaxID=1280846 RepID=UPI001B7FF96C|nr:helix-turn-helix domain-containing protein [Aliiruegeria haliotis]